MRVFVLLKAVNEEERGHGFMKRKKLKRHGKLG